MAASYYVNTFDLPPDQARAIWREITDETYELTSAACAGSDYRFATRMWFAPDNLFFRVRAKANTIFRPSKLVGTAHVLTDVAFDRMKSHDPDLALKFQTYALEYVSERLANNLRTLSSILRLEE